MLTSRSPRWSTTQCYQEDETTLDCDLQLPVEAAGQLLPSYQALLESCMSPKCPKIQFDIVWNNAYKCKRMHKFMQMSKVAKNMHQLHQIHQKMHKLSPPSANSPWLQNRHRRRGARRAWKRRPGYRSRCPGCIRLPPRGGPPAKWHINDILRRVMMSWPGLKMKKPCKWTKN